MARRRCCAGGLTDRRLGLGRAGWLAGGRRGHGPQGHILLMGAVESLQLAALFALSHNFEGAERFPHHEEQLLAGAGQRSAGPRSRAPDWFTSQVETSSTYGALSVERSGAVSVERGVRAS